MKETVLDSDFLILNRIPSLYSARRIKEEISQLKLNGLLISPEKIGQYLSQFEARGFSPAVLYRQGDFRFWETQHLVSNYPGVVKNEPQTFLIARDKWRTYLSWQKKDLPTPLTFKASDFFSNADNKPNDIFNKIQIRMGLPFIFKKRISSQGRGVFKIETASQWNEVLNEDLKDFQRATYLENHYFKIENPSLSDFGFQLNRWIVQECIHESLGIDIRSFHIGEHHLSIRRENKISFQSNLHRGGKAEFTELNSAETILTLLAYKQSGLHYAGIDFLRTSRGPLLLEINPSPGFEGIEQVHPFNVAREIIRLVTV